MIRLAALDMAGTTVDDGGRVYDALRAAVEETGAVVAAEDLQAWMGADKVTAVAALMRLGGVEPAPGQADTQFGRFKEILSASYRADPPTPIAGADRAIARLRERGIKVALTTGFDDSVTRILLDVLDWRIAEESGVDDAATLLDAVVTTDDVSAGRPAPYMIHRAMERTGVVDVASVLVAGDTAVDLRAGRNSGGIAVGVLTGGASRSVLESQPHDHILGSVAEILDLPEAQPEK